ncbi:DEAD/DEAH box helicase [Spirosoma sp. KUDC1026]|uniref:DEAD/DEAH box helicase n=1 Tax=Spirosoma sp. KUDC1026 TaxID=2745947 RepID=UPI00159B8FD9|nr:DEAD/DEAH box helicase [Spirosoma sp. KUDC1026]QKZ13770.1 DEAD/DEAH box helicase [Spirosoma sp. KUDC1026]
MITPQQPDQLLANLGITALNPMQLAAQQAIQTTTDTILIAPTGSGKTVAFLLPMLQLLNPGHKGVQCLILVPSRELALQIEQVWKTMATGYKVNVCYGGHSIDTEIRNLSNPPAVMIGTPGRISDHIDRQSFARDGIHTLILDEFDKSLTLGFQEEMAFIIDGLQDLRQRVLVSATASLTIPDFVGLQSPKILTFIPDDTQTGNLTTEVVYATRKDKIDTLFDLLCTLDSEPALIFCNLRETADRCSALLTERGIYARAYHGGMEQEDRERALIQFRNGSVRYLVTTDLAARGLDIPEMKYVIHYHLPPHEPEFVHRNGRTARMQASGTVYVIVHRDEIYPSYLPTALPEFRLPSTQQPLPNPPDFQTLYISGGKKNKVNKVDIVGFFRQKGGLDKGDLGRIDVQDFMSFAAVRTEKVAGLLASISQQKMKGKKYKIEVAR